MDEVGKRGVWCLKKGLRQIVWRVMAFKALCFWWLAFDNDNYKFIILVLPKFVTDRSLLFQVLPGMA